MASTLVALCHVYIITKRLRTCFSEGIPIVNEPYLVGDTPEQRNEATRPPHSLLTYFELFTFAAGNVVATLPLAQTHVPHQILAHITEWHFFSFFCPIFRSHPAADNGPKQPLRIRNPGGRECSHKHQIHMPPPIALITLPRSQRCTVIRQQVPDSARCGQVWWFETEWSPTPTGSHI